MNTKTEKPKYFGPKTEKPIEIIAKTAKPKIPMPPSQSFRYFYFTGGTPVDDEYEPQKYGVPQIENVHLDVLGLCTSRTDKCCLGDLLNSECFIGEAEDELVEEPLSSVS